MTETAPQLYGDHHPGLTYSAQSVTPVPPSLCLPATQPFVPVLDSQMLQQWVVLNPVDTGVTNAALETSRAPEAPTKISAAAPRPSLVSEMFRKLKEDSVPVRPAQEPDSLRKTAFNCIEVPVEVHASPSVSARPRQFSPAPPTPRPTRQQGFDEISDPPCHSGLSPSFRPPSRVSRVRKLTLSNFSLTRTHP